VPHTSPLLLPLHPRPPHAGITTENSAVTISKFILDQVMIEWNKPELNAGAAPAPAGSSRG